MNREELLANLSKKKVQDYGFTILFFVLFSFFLMFAIRPNILTAFNLEKELEQLKTTNQAYEQVIMNIVNYQTLLEANRDNFYLLDEAVPQSPQVYKIVDDLRKSASDSAIAVNKLEVNQLNLTDSGKATTKLQTYAVQLETNASLVKIKDFIDRFMMQRRLKTLRQLNINKSEDDSTIFKIQFEIEGFYL